MKIILLGAPGCGKGTQGERIAKRLSIPVISTGDILRAAVKAGTEVGLRAKGFMDAGKLVPDQVVIDIIRERLAGESGGYILDGFPRTVPQAEALRDAGLSPDAVLAIDVPDETIERRMTGRRVCPHCSATFHTESRKPQKEGICDACGGELVIRADDAPETVRQRLRTYHEQSEPLIGFYEREGKLRLVAGEDGVDHTTEKIFEAFGI